MIYQGGCHCGAIAFEVEAAADLVVHECNCSICVMSGHWHLIVPQARFTLLQGESGLSTYTFNTGVAKHRFCSVCGIKSFYIPRSNPDGVDVNARCLSTEPASLRIEPFDGANWEQHAHKVAQLSKEPQGSL
jgi:hypothetical protein